MNHYTIEILNADINYVLEAIRMRGHALADQIAGQVLRAQQAEQAAKAAAAKAEWTVSTADNGNMVASIKEPAKKRGRPAKKRGRPAKTSAKFVATRDFVASAPWGLKKDGTPKQRPGRKTAK